MADSLSVGKNTKYTNVSFATYFRQVSNAPTEKKNYGYFHLKLYRTDIHNGENWNRELIFNSDHAFRYYSDSVLLKERDSWMVLVNFNDKSIEQVQSAFSLSFSTQFFNKYVYVNNRKNRVEGFGIPSLLQLDYGFRINIFSELRFSFDVSSIRLELYPAEEKNLMDSEITVDLENAILNARLGFRSRLLLEKEFREKIRWKYQSDVFLSGLDNSKINAEVLNEMSLKLYKTLSLRILTELKYNPYYSQKTQVSNQIMLGLDLFKAN